MFFSIENGIKLARFLFLMQNMLMGWNNRRFDRWREGRVWNIVANVGASRRARYVEAPKVCEFHVKGDLEVGTHLLVNKKSKYTGYNIMHRDFFETQRENSQNSQH